MMTEPRAQELIDEYIEGYNMFDVSAMLLCLHPDIVFENMAHGVVTLRIEGKDAFEAQATKATELFMERIQHVLKFSFELNRAEVDIDFFAITAIEWPNGWKPGTILQFKGQSIFTFRDGLIASIQDIS